MDGGRPPGEGGSGRRVRHRHWSPKPRDERALPDLDEPY
jgi:hypothetical protein